MSYKPLDIRRASGVRIYYTVPAVSERYCDLLASRAKPGICVGLVHMRYCMSISLRPVSVF